MPSARRLISRFRSMLTRWHSLAVIALVVTAGTTVAQETLQPGAKLTRLEVYPASVTLKHPFDYNQLLVTGILADGERIDVTRLVKVEAPAAVKVSPAGIIRPTADGNGSLRFSFLGQSAEVPVKVSGQKDK